MKKKILKRIIGLSIVFGCLVYVITAAKMWKEIMIISGLVGISVLLLWLFGLWEKD